MSSVRSKVFMFSLISIIRAKFHMSCVMCHISDVTGRLSPVTCNLLLMPTAMDPPLANSPIILTPDRLKVHGGRLQSYVFLDLMYQRIKCLVIRE